MTSARTTAQAGFSLIEVMVSVLVLSLAFLSLGMLAARSLSSNNNAMSHSVATIAMYSIMDALRADRSNATSGGYNNSNQDIVANACASLTPTQLEQWCEKQLADSALGGEVDTTKARINCDATSGDCTINITWADGRSANASTTQTVTTTGKL